MFEINSLSFGLYLSYSTRCSTYSLFNFSNVIIMYFFLKTDFVKCQTPLDSSSYFSVSSIVERPFSTKRSCVVTPHKCMIAWNCFTQCVSEFSVYITNSYQPDIILNVSFNFHPKLKWANTRSFPLVTLLG